MLTVEAVSSLWTTPSVGSPGPDFLNAAALISTASTLEELRSQILRPIENLLGRVRTQDPNAPRTMDLDPLIFDGTQLDEQLWEYAHMAIPVAEILPDYIDPSSGRSAAAIATNLLKIAPIRKAELDLHWASAA